MKKKFAPYRGGRLESAFPQTLSRMKKLLARFFVLGLDLETQLTPESDASQRDHIPTFPSGDRPAVRIPDQDALDEAALLITARIASEIGREADPTEVALGVWEEDPKEIAKYERMFENKVYFWAVVVGRLPFRAVDAYAAWWSASDTWLHVRWAWPSRWSALCTAAYWACIGRSAGTVARYTDWWEAVARIDAEAPFPAHDLDPVSIIAAATQSELSVVQATDPETGEPVLGVTDHDYEIMLRTVVYHSDKLRVDGYRFRWTPTDEEISAAAGGVKLDPSQAAAVRGIAAAGVGIATGFPGSGKSTIIKVLADIYRHRLPDSEIIAIAPTGRAARRIAECGVPASTVHSRLRIAPGLERGLAVCDGALHCELPEHAVWIIDEASMLDLSLVAVILRAACESHARALVLVGDPDQLPPIGPGKIFEGMLKCGRLPVFRLTENHRQQPGCRLLTDSLGVIRAGGTRLLTPETVGDDSRYAGDTSLRIERHISDRALTQRAVDLYREHCPDRRAASVRILTPLRQDRFSTGSETINQSLHNAYRKTGEPEVPVGPGILETPARETAKVSLFDPVFFIDNRLITQPDGTSVRVFNGLDGVIVNVSPATEPDPETGDPGEPASVLVLTQGALIAVIGEDLASLDLGYACSVHRAQGGEVETVILLLPQLADDYRMGARELVYTGLSRATTRAVILEGPADSPMSLLESALTSARVLERIDGIEQTLKRMKTETAVRATAERRASK